MGALEILMQRRIPRIQLGVFLSLCEKGCISKPYHEHYEIVNNLLEWLGPIQQTPKSTIKISAFEHNHLIDWLAYKSGISPAAILEELRK